MFYGKRIRRALALGQAKDSTFRDRLLPDDKLECLSNTLHSMSRSTLFNSFMFYEVSHPAADQLQINTENKSIVFSQPAAGTLPTNSHTFYPSEISQMVSFLGQLWRLPPGLPEHHSSPGPGSHFVLKLIKLTKRTALEQRARAESKGSNLRVGISATFLPTENCHKFPPLSSRKQIFYLNCCRLVNTNTLLDDQNSKRQVKTNQLKLIKS